jgi:hypothetical protein
MAWRRPALTAGCVLTIALGVGANASIVGVLQTVLLNPLGLCDADRVMAVRVSVDKLKMYAVETSGVEYREVRDMSTDFRGTLTVTVI